MTLFPALRPEDPGGFPNVGTRGCFLSHLGVLRAARESGAGTILVLEDDALFLDRFVQIDRDEAQRIAGMPWDMLYFGHLCDDERDGTTGSAVATESGAEAGTRSVPGDVGVERAHAFAVRSASISRLIAYLEAMLARPPGDPAGGPMHVDGAYSWYRKEHPEVETLPTRVQWIVQRASRTDIHPAGWKERIPFIGLARRVHNFLARR